MSGVMAPLIISMMPRPAATAALRDAWSAPVKTML
jgi:hypothetical protein